MSWSCGIGGAAISVSLVHEYATVNKASEDTIMLFFIEIGFVFRFIEFTVL
jgi:hypothetical protein